MKPTISIVIVNKNGGKKLKLCLEAIAKQDYPKKLIEILIVDGGSTDNSRDLAKSFSARFIDGGFPDNMEARRQVGVSKSKNEIIVFIDTDNYMPTKRWLSQMIEPFVDDANIFASQTLRYTHRKSDSLLNRYFALFGFNDPVAYYLGKADRLSYFDKDEELSGDMIDLGHYYKVTFILENLPTVGCNGFLIRKSILKKVLTKPENFFHIDVIADLVKKGHRNIAFVKNGIIHDTSENLRHLISKRIKYYNNHSVLLTKRRRYKLYDPHSKTDNLKLLLFIFYSLTIIEPLSKSIRGYLKVRDLAWFLHPLVCIMFFVSYTIAIIRNATNKLSV